MKILNKMGRRRKRQSFSIIFLLTFFTPISLVFHTSSRGSIVTLVNSSNEQNTDQKLSLLDQNLTNNFITFSTFIGGGDQDTAFSSFVDAYGNIYVAGLTYSTDFPTKGENVDRTYNGGFVHHGWDSGGDGFISKFNSEGELIFSTYLGGGSGEYVTSMFVDLDENVYLTGLSGFNNDQWIDSPDFPIVGVKPNSNFESSGWVFLSKLDKSGSLVFSTLFGGSEVLTYSRYQKDRSIFVDHNKNIYIGGSVEYSNTSTFPIIGDYSTSTRATHRAPFITKFNSTGVIQYSKYIAGGLENERGAGVNAIYGDKIGNIYAVGHYTSSYDGNSSIFISKFDPDGALLFLKMDQSIDREPKYPDSMCVDENHNIYISGDTWGENRKDAFVSKFDNSGNLIFSSYLGGSVPISEEGWGSLAHESAHSVVVDPQENIYVTGETSSTDFPIIGENSNNVHNGDVDIFLSKFGWSGELVFSTLIGGNEFDVSNSIFLDNYGDIYLVGHTSSPDFPIIGTNANSTFGGDSEAFLMKINCSIGLCGPSFDRAITETNEELALPWVEENIVPLAIISLSTFGLGGLVYYTSIRSTGVESAAINDATKNTVKRIFNGNTSKYLLVAGNIFGEKKYGSATKIPQELFNYKLLLHPTRIAMMKVLIDNPLM
ncbi:MAG: SBBP repeat-containing protein, partial [Candidatus Kariarchaeaceae archaeon]